MDSFNEVWLQVLAYCRQDNEIVNEVAYNLWFLSLKPIRFDGITAEFTVSSEFKKNIIIDKYLTVIKNGFSKAVGFEVDIVINVDSVTAATAATTVSTPPVQPVSPIRPVSDIHPENEDPDENYEYSFANFIVGSGNKFAHAACTRVADAPGKAYNPLFIYGRSGLGKTHLLNAIAYQIGSNDPSASILYTTGENFTNELIACLAQKNTEAFHNKYRNVDVLLVDDVHFIAGKVSTQEEFFHTFNALTQAGKQVVLASDRPPKEMDTLEERLRNRFEWGLIADIQPPDIDTRMAIIKKKAVQFNVKLPDIVVEYIAERLKTNIRQIEGTVKKLYALTLVEGTSPTVDMADTAIRDIMTDNQPLSVRIDKIIESVANFYGISPDDIRSEKKTATVTLARQVAMYVIREVTAQPLQAIGAAFGGKNHSTVHYSLNIIEKKIEEDSAFKNTVYDMIRNIQD